jgi:hypothetical protein
MFLVIYLYEVRVNWSATQFKSVWHVTSLTYNLRYKIKHHINQHNEKRHPLTSFEYLVVFRKLHPLKYHNLSVDFISFTTRRSEHL